MSDDRILVLMPTSKDAERTRRALAKAGLEAAICKNIDELCREIAVGADAALLTEEATAARCLHEVLRDQPAWSDFPLVVLTHEGVEGRNLRESINATLIERPVKIRSLVSVLRAALRSRRHQYAVRDHLEAIRQARERYRVTLSSIGDAVIATDAEGRVSFMNRVAEVLTGWPQAEAAGRTLSHVFRIIHEHTREPAENPALRALRDGAVVGLANHTLLVARDGTERSIDDSAAPMREGTASVGAVLVFRDVTERRRADVDRARLAAIVESSDDAIIGKALDGTILSWNAGAHRLFGYTADEAVGNPITMLIPNELLGEERSIIERLRRGERVEHFETTRVVKGGRRVDVSLTISPIRNGEGEVVGASKVARDITEKRRAATERERLLSEAEAERARLEEVFRLAPSFMAVLRGPTHVFERANARYRELVGGRELIGKTVREALPEIEGQGFFEILDQVYATGEAYAESDARVMLHSAAGAVEHVLEFVYQPLRRADGEVSGVLVQGIDLTKKKRAEAGLARVREDSERRRRLYETALNNTPDLVYVFGLDHRFTYANEALLKMWGKSWDEAIGRTCLELYSARRGMRHSS